VRGLFDQYASHFDEHLVGKLGYQTPAIIGEAVRRLGVARADTFDLGCGTGLCAPILRGVSNTLVGVDLSQNMLDRAAQRGLYDALHCADIAAFLAPKTHEADLIVAADVFVYIGDLAELFTGMRQALRAGGHACFSVEDAGEGKGNYVLRASNRYAHSLAYIENLASDCGLTLLEAQPHVLRRDGDLEVAGYVITLAKIETI
jgi:predicted TPR repeat methyltransferase